VGYLLSPRQLDCQVFSRQDTSIAHLSTANSADIRDLIVGTNSFGTLLNNEGYHSMPSSLFPCIMGKSYYSGGYNTQRHGSHSGGIVDGIQIEVPKIYRQQSNIPAFAKALARVIQKYVSMSVHNHN